MAHGKGADPKGVATRGVVRLGDGAARDERDAVAVEEPLEIRVDGETVAVTMRTPGQDAELALGFLFAEGIIAGKGDVGSVSHCGRPGEEGYGNVVEVRSAGGAPIDAERILEGRRWVTTTSACGVCGRRSIEELLARCGRVDRAVRLSGPAVVASVERLASAQPIFGRTGGLHAAALFAEDGALLAAAEDVGRHNAVDKAVGALMRRGLVGRGAAAAGGAARPGLLAVSGRASFEIVQKAAAAGVPVVASVSAPSSLAVDLADQAGIALLGFVRGGRLNVYANAWRIEGAGAERADGGPAGVPLPGSVT
ncbi:MAG TPA: formate dehydrogenase accessory sulfurtransferase FdhD [Anaeromyxobacteraceae bacterium]|nr:formate dehydrogenase accessory sulfurtransferase FdhD [Anaeromyxobacteraceae bacterium]